MSENGKENLKLVKDQNAETQKKHIERGQKIVEMCELEYIKVSDRAQEACKNIENIMQSCALELALILPDGWRTSEAFERLEEVTMWAKKSVCVYDKTLTKAKEAYDKKTAN